VAPWLDDTQLAAFIVAMLALNLSPGPNMLFALASSLAGGRRDGVLAALGAGIGLLGHVAIATWLAAAMVRLAPAMLDALRAVGAAYLVWLGIRSVRAPAPSLQGPRARLSTATLLVRGMVTSLTNPKPALFFLAFLPQFTNAAAGSVVAQMLTLGVVFTASATTVNASVGLAGGAIERWLAQRSTAARWPLVAGGVTMIVLGAGLAAQTVLAHLDTVEAG
jgi:threonine/homoserine/homoserine lactone efflux protein